MFIDTGEVEIFITENIFKNKKKNSDSKILFNLEAGKSFGELEFFTGQNRSINVKSKDFTTVLKINRDKFI